jgi:hypothetical protein
MLASGSRGFTRQRYGRNKTEGSELNVNRQLPVPQKLKLAGSQGCRTPRQPFLLMPVEFQKP